MNTTRSFIVALGLLAGSAALVAPIGGCSTYYGGPTATAERKQTVASAASLTVESRNGGIKVLRDDSLTEVTVTARVRCAGKTQAEADQRVAAAALVVDRQSDGAVRIAVNFPPRADDANGRYSNDGASFEVRAPAGIDGLDLSTSNGGIVTEGFKGQLRARSSNGGIKVTDHDGGVQVDSSNGAIEAVNIGGPADIETSNGSVDVSLREGATQNVTVRTSNGSVLLSLPGSWNGAMTAKTSNGKVTVQADDGRATSVTASRGEGSATIGQGTATASVRSSNGSVKVVVRK